jgi:hypothetical protein
MTKIKRSFKETLPKRQQPRKTGTSGGVAIHSPAKETKQNYY